MRVEEEWKPEGRKVFGIKKPKQAVRTRWLCILDSILWLMPRLHTIKEVVRKHFLLDKDRKVKKKWVEVYAILSKPEIELYGTFLATWATLFFKPGLKWMEKGMPYARPEGEQSESEATSSSGFRASEMPQKVREWVDDVNGMVAGYDIRFEKTIFR